MPDIVTYCENTQALIQELKEKYPDRIYKDENSDDYTFIVNKTPTIRNGNKTLSLLRVTEEEYEMIQNLDSLEILGTYDEIFNNEEKLSKYKSVWDYETPIEYTEEDGTVRQYYRPKKFGVFA